MEAGDYARAASYAAYAHRLQRRKSPGQPAYDIHVMKVGSLLMNVPDIPAAQRITIGIAGLLHDTLEDTEVTYQQLATHFGKEVADIVQECTDDRSLSKRQRKVQQLAKAASKSYGAKLVKMADMVDNLGDWLEQLPVGTTVAQREGYFVWKYAIFQHMQGLNNTLDMMLETLFARGLPADQWGIPIRDPTILEQRAAEYFESC